jgi:hypothetical protein
MLSTGPSVQPEASRERLPSAHACASVNLAGLTQCVVPRVGPCEQERSRGRMGAVALSLTFWDHICLSSPKWVLFLESRQHWGLVELCVTLTLTIWDSASTSRPHGEEKGQKGHLPFPQRSIFA